MTWLSIILFLIQYGPAIFQLVSEIIELIGKLRSFKEQDAFKAELESAVKDYKANRDRRGLYALRDKLRKACYGESCP